MRELHLIGLHDDGEHLVLADGEGRQFSLAVTEALRAAVRRDRPALSLLQASDRNPLRPREIQAMLRAGHDAEEIAELAQCSLDHVKRYEGPVLAERAWIAQQARAYPVGRGGGPSLEQVVRERLSAREAGEDTAWDAWRRENGTWTLEIAFTAGGRGRVAHWVVDTLRRTVAPEDDEARWLTEDEADRPAPMGRARLAAVKNAVYDVEADGGVDRSPAPIDERELDRLNARRGIRRVPQPPEEPQWRSVEDEVAAERESAKQSHPSSRDADRSPRALPDPEPDAAGPTGPADSDAGDADHVGDAGGAGAGADTADPAGSGDAAERSTSQVGPRTTVAPQPPREAPGMAADAGAAADATTDGVQQLPVDDEPATSAPKSVRKRSKRSSVPTWDEIVFGSKHD